MFTKGVKEHQELYMSDQDSFASLEVIGRERGIKHSGSEKPECMYSQDYHLLNMKCLDQDIIDTFPQTAGEAVFFGNTITTE